MSKRIIFQVFFIQTMNFKHAISDIGDDGKQNTIKVLC